jgi:type IV pilus biogenesis protein CpaD/CtpE
MARKLLAVILAGLLAGCTSQPSCYETPRNMRCMSGPELSRALNDG